MMIVAGNFVIKANKKSGGVHIMLHYEIYFDETGSFKDNKSAVVGFYFEIETDFTEYNNKHNEIIEDIKQYFEKLESWKGKALNDEFADLGVIFAEQCKRFSVSENDLIECIQGYDFEHCTNNNNNYKYRDLIQMICLKYWINCFKKMKEDEKIKDYGLIFFKNNFYLGGFLKEKPSDENTKDSACIDTSLEKFAKTFNDAFSADPYLNTVAEGIVNFWMRKKLFNKSSAFHIYPSVRKLGEYESKTLGIIEKDRYVAYLAKVAKTRLDEKHFAAFCKDLLEYKIIKDDDKNQTPQKKNSFDLSKFEKYMEDIKSGCKLNYKWEYCDIHLVHNSSPEVYTTYIGDCFANSFWRKNKSHDNDTKIEKLYQDIFDGVENKIFVNTIKVEDGLEDSLHIFFKDLMEENVIDILRDLYITPKIQEKRDRHDESYANDYKSFIEKNQFIIDYTRQILLQLAPIYKKGTWEQLLNKLQTEVSRIEKNFKNILIVENLEKFFSHKEIKNSCEPWIELLYIDFKIFKQKIYLDYGRLKEAVDLYHDISGLCNSTTTPGVNPAFLQERKLKAKINQLNYYCYTFDYDTAQRFFKRNYNEPVVGNQDYGKLVNIFLNTKILDARTNKFSYDDLLKYKGMALQHFQYDGDDSRTYQICAKLANEMIVNVKSEEGKNRLRGEAETSLYNAAGLKGEDATLKNFLDSIFIESRDKKVIGDVNKEFLFLLFIELLLKNDALIEDLFELHENNTEYGFYKIKDDKMEPNCIIYWKLGRLKTKLNSKNKSISSLLYQKFNKVDDWDFYNKALEFFESHYTHNYAQDPLLALVKIGILCDAIKDNNPRNCTIYCYLERLKKAVEEFCNLCNEHNLNNVISGSSGDIAKIKLINSMNKRVINGLMKETLKCIPL